MFLFSSDKYLYVELLDHMAVLFLNLGTPSMLFFLVAAPIDNASNSACGFPLLHIFANTCSVWSFCVDTLAGVRWHLMVILIYVCLMISEFGYIFMYLVAIYMSFLEKMSTHILCSFLIGWFFIYYFLVLSWILTPY